MPNFGVIFCANIVVCLFDINASWKSFSKKFAPCRHECLTDPAHNTDNTRWRKHLAQKSIPDITLCAQSFSQIFGHKIVGRSLDHQSQFTTHARNYGRKFNLFKTFSKQTLETSSPTLGRVFSHRHLRCEVSDPNMDQRLNLA